MIKVQVKKTNLYQTNNGQQSLEKHGKNLYFKRKACKIALPTHAQVCAI